jgi:hypothetical protein
MTRGILRDAVLRAAPQDEVRTVRRAPTYLSGVTVPAPGVVNAASELPLIRGAAYAVRPLLERTIRPRRQNRPAMQAFGASPSRAILPYSKISASRVR